jgi:allophanate hydrolase subunit 1
LNDPNLGRDIDLFIGPLEGVIDVVSSMRSLLVEFLLRVEALLA